MRNASPLWHMKGVDDKMRMPLLLLQGEEDERVALAQSRGFHRGCKSLAWDCTFVTYHRKGHIIVKRGHVVDMLERMGRFYDLHLR
jgi:dipeptidyl aminopeptidase/acylaminoacyl peptidase